MDHPLKVVSDTLCQHLDNRSLAALRCTSRSFEAIAKDLCKRNNDDMEQLLIDLSNSAQSLQDELDEVYGVQYDLHFWFRYDDAMYKCLLNLSVRMQSWCIKNLACQSIYEFVPTLIQYVLSKGDPLLREYVLKAGNYLSLIRKDCFDRNYDMFMERLERKLYCTTLFQERLDGMGYSSLLCISGKERLVLDSAILIVRHLILDGSRLYGKLLQEAEDLIRTELIETFQGYKAAVSRYQKNKAAALRHATRWIADRQLVYDIRRSSFRDSDPIDATLHRIV